MGLNACKPTLYRNCRDEQKIHDSSGGVGHHTHDLAQLAHIIPLGQVLLPYPAVLIRHITH